MTAVLLVAAALVASSLSGIAGAVTGNDDQIRTTYDICVSQAPTTGFTRSEAEEDIEDAIAVWNNVPHLNSGFAIDIEMVTCGTTEEITVKRGSTGGGAAKFNGSEIIFDQDGSWCVEAALGPLDECDTDPDTGEFSYIGVAMHELGHTLGISHSGNCKWQSRPSGCDATYQTHVPTMTALGTVTRSYKMKTLGWEARSAVQWVDNYSKTTKWWTKDPGFEIGNLGGWYHTNATIVTTPTKQGSYAVKLDPGEHLRATTVYDPWNGPPEAHPGLDETDKAPLGLGMVSTLYGRLRTDYYDEGNLDGGVQLRYKYRFVDYNTALTKDGLQTTSSWSATTTSVGTCNSSNGFWHTCDPTPNVPGIPLGADIPIPPYGGTVTNVVNNAVALRAKFVSKNATEDLILDLTGIRGW